MNFGRPEEPGIKNSTEVLKEMGAQPFNADPCVFKLKRRGAYAIIVTYVATESDDLLNEIKRNLCQYFVIKDLGEIHHCLGMEFYRTAEGIHVNQKGYIIELLKKYGMSDCKPVGTPMDPGIKLRNPEEEHNAEELP